MKQRWRGTMTIIAMVAGIVGAVAAQPQRPGGGGGNPPAVTVPAGAGGASSASLQATAQALQGAAGGASSANLQATAQALQGAAGGASSANLQATAQALQATAGAIQTTLTAVAPAVDQAALQATAYAASTQIFTLAGAGATAVPISTLEALLASSIVTVGADGQSLTLSSQLGEAALNLLISEAMAAAGYPNSSFDLIPGGFIFTVPNITLERLTGTLVANGLLYAEAGRAVVLITSATINQVAVPSALITELQSELTAALEAALASVATTASGGGSISYSVDALTATDTALLFTLTVAWDVAVTVPAGGNAPAITPPALPTRRR